MKCQHAEKLILLDDAGGLRPHRKRALAIHLGTCSGCRAFNRLVGGVKEAARLAAEPSAKTMQNVLRQARLNASERRTAKMPVWKPAMATVLPLLLVAGFLMTALRPGKVGMELVVTETQLLDTEDQVVSLMYSGLSEDDLAFNFLMTYEGS